MVWREHLSDDFSFIEQWDYTEGVYQNEFGQLTCDGLCPPETDGMKDEKGMILVDSLTAFYQLVDTMHQFHTIQSDAWCYEWAGTNFATALKLGPRHGCMLYPHQWIDPLQPAPNNHQGNVCTHHSAEQRCWFDHN